jgi:excisionase family DNA binding protein
MHPRNDETFSAPDGTLALTNTLLLTVPEAATHLRLSEREVRRLIAQDRLPVLRFGRQVRIAFDDLRAYVRRARRFQSYFLTPDTFKLTRRVRDEERLADEFAWD